MVDQSISATPGRTFQFVGGELCLDFCNTVGGKRGATTREYLTSYQDLVSWAEQAGLVDKPQANALEQVAQDQPGEAARVLERALSLRESIYRVVHAVAAGKSPAAEDLKRLNAELAATIGRLQVAKRKAGFTWEWARDPAALDQPIGPIAHSAAELLTGIQFRGQVRRCEGHNCGWLFVDSSKNHSRRWCDMRDCGNRAKVRRHRLKMKSQA